MNIMNFKFPKSLASEDAQGYIFFSDGVRIENGSLILNANSWVRFDSYHNFIPLAKLRTTTNYYDLSIEFSGLGSCTIELFGIVQEDHYRKQILVKIVTGELNNGLKINIPDNIMADLLYVRVTANSEHVKLSTARFNASCSHINNIQLAYIICSYNREWYIQKFIEDVGDKFIDRDEIKFYLVQNGSTYNIKYPNNFEVIINRNLGGAGGFTRGITCAMDQKRFTHVILADDDICIECESIDRTINFLKGVKPEFSDCFISGAMLSLDQRWLQYERTSSLDGRGFHPRGTWIDIRDNQRVAEDIISDIEPGLAGWWYCCIPVKIFDEYGLPLPIFVRGDDVEFSYRCNKKIITLNGICVWHEPFIKKYHEIMEDYYLVRNMTAVSLLYNDSLKGLRNIFFAKKILKNIACFDYIAANFNIRAVNALLNGEIYKPADLLHNELNDELSKMLSKLPSWHGSRAQFQNKRIKQWKKILLIFLQFIFGFRKGHSFSNGGFDRKVDYFVGKSAITVYNGNGMYREYKFSWRKSVKLLVAFILLYLRLAVNAKELERKVILFRDKAVSRDYWNSIFHNK